MSGIDEVNVIPEDYPQCGCRDDFFWTGKDSGRGCCLNPNSFLKGMRGRDDKVFPTSVGRKDLDSVHTIICVRCQRKATEQEFRQIMLLAYSIVDEFGRI